MTELFHGSLSEEAPKSTLTFWGELATAVERAESLFMNHGYWRAYQDGSFLLIDPQTQQVSGIEAPEEALEKFAAFMSTISLKSYEVDISRPLRLVDCWEDDPIGSGAMQIFNRSSGLNQQQLDQIRALFSPYEDVIYPEHVTMFSSAEDIKRMLEEGQQDPVFTNELEKRRARSESLGIPFSYAANQEIVWVSLTTKLRTWAIENGYNSFVYEGRHEGTTLDSYVTLTDEQVIDERKKLSFDREAFIQGVMPKFAEFLREKNPKEIGTDVYWAGNKPTEYWM